MRASMPQSYLVEVALVAILMGALMVVAIAVVDALV
jgi:hypothetical protein